MQQAGLKIEQQQPQVKHVQSIQPVVIQEQVIFHHPQPSTIKIEQTLPDNLTNILQTEPETSHMTLNRLNAQEEEMMDEDSFQSEVKIETSFAEVSWSKENDDSEYLDDDADEEYLTWWKFYWINSPYTLARLKYMEF
jgi:hypothetical protein